ncbi:hypothetical protein QYF61_024949 [Mycteria americana]|uniref:Core shell protein Gag P30 domain-containing protein n=1 Tax=Mycteria americana TaxID=33587 RepID=A0AAN7NML2_MYCAM|nr:hypothetical protein QYF61_024949 [Mycteria americana]
MGGQQSGGVVKKSPLGCMLAHWKEIGGQLGGSLNKKILIKYCNQWLEDGEKWPFNGSLIYNTILQLTLFLWREGKWDEVMYADMFFTLRNHLEWQKDCGVNIPPQDPLVLSLEGKREYWTKVFESNETQKKKKEEVEDQPEDLGLPPPPPPPPPPAVLCETDGGSEEEKAADDFTLVTARTRSKTQKALQLLAPLREVMGVGGPARVKVPFSTADLDAWREVARGYRDDPSRVAKRFELIIKNQDPDWTDVDLILEELTETEKQLVLKTARTHVQAQITGGPLQGNVDNYIPLTDPHWGPNDGRDYRLLRRYRDWIKLGLENAVSKAVNWSALYAIKQGQRETPTEFMDQLRNAMRKYTTLDPSSDVGQQQLVSLFLGQSSMDIRKKLQKLKNRK